MLRMAQASTPALGSTFLMQIVGHLDDAQVIGPTPTGTRRILYMTGGSFSGAGLNGDVLPGGGDWVLLRADGVSQLDIRFTLRSDDGALIYVRSSGLFDIDPSLRSRILQGEKVDPSEYYFRTALAFETAADNLAWLNRLIAVGVGARTAQGMVTQVFAIT
jgi:hypothetical protein